MATGPSPLLADLVLEGGGVKGLGTAGAVMRLLEAGYRFPRAAGTSVGAIAAAVVAAGVDAVGLQKVMERLDLPRVPDRAAPHLPFVSEGLTLYSSLGAYQGDYIHDWLHRELRRLGVVTFGDLRRMDVGDDEHLTDEQRYSLVVMATDVTRGRLLRLPWDYRLFNLDPDAQLVADAVRMSLSIPLFFEPCSLTNAVTGEISVIVDGGVLSNFAIEVFDRTDGKKPRWPTFGVRLLPDLPAGNAHVFPALALPLVPPLRLVEQVLTTSLVGRDQTHLDRPGVRERTMTIDTSGVGITDFRVTEGQRQRLLRQGREGAEAFLTRWTGGVRPPSRTTSGRGPTSPRSRLERITS